MHSQAEASLHNIKIEILSNGSPTATQPEQPCACGSPSISGSEISNSPMSTLPVELSRPCLIPALGISQSPEPRPPVKLSTPCSTPSPGNSNESASTCTSPVFPVVVDTNVKQQSVMMGRLLETVNLMQQRMDRMEKQLHKLLSNQKVTFFTLCFLL